MAQASSLAGDRQWFVVGRRQEYEGEARANLIRLVGISGFYSIELLNYYGLNLGVLRLLGLPGVSAELHRMVTALAVSWTALALGIELCLRSRIFPASLKYLSTGGDLLLLLSLLLVVGGARSPLVILFFPLIALAALRLSRGLIWVATCGSLAGYVVLLGHDKWWPQGPGTPRHQQLIYLLSIALTGVTLGQIVRRFRWLADEYSQRISSSKRELP